jgi:hypothetical protein
MLYANGAGFDQFGEKESLVRKVIFEIKIYGKE